MKKQTQTKTQPLKRTLLDRAVAYVSPAAGVKRMKARMQLDLAQRSYEAARPGRNTQGWYRPATSGNSEVYQAIPWLRAGARDLVRNNPHAARIIDVLQNNLVGDGILSEPATGSIARDKQVAQVFAEFRAQIDIEGLETFEAQQRTAVRGMCEGGETIVRRVRRRLQDGLCVPIQCQVLEGDFVDYNRNEILADGRILQGIEFDRIGQRRAMWMFEEHPGDSYMRTGGSYRVNPVDADQLIHLFERLRPGQIRGLPWIAPCMVRLLNLDDYEEAERARKRIEACITAIVRGDSSDEGSAKSLAPTVTDFDGNLLEMFEPGLIAYASGAEDVAFNQPAQSSGYAPYKRSELQSVAAGARVTYELVSGDYTGVNYTTLRGSTKEFQRFVRSTQRTMIIPRYCQRIYREAIQTAIAVGRLPADTPTATFWHPPRFDAIDPLKEAQATLIKVRSGVMTLFQAIGEQGYDPNRQLDEIAKIAKLLDKNKLILDTDPRRVNQKGLGQPDNSEPANEDGNATPDQQAEGDGISEEAADRMAHLIDHYERAQGGGVYQLF